MYKKILKNLDLIFGCTALVLIICMTFINVVCRYALGFIFTSFEELCLILFVWICYIGASTSYRNDGHIAIDAIYDLFPAVVKKWLDVLIAVLNTVTFVYTSYLAYVICANLGVKVTNTLRLPYIVYNGAILFSFVLMSIYSIFKLIHAVKCVTDPHSPATAQQD